MIEEKKPIIRFDHTSLMIIALLVVDVGSDDGDCVVVRLSMLVGSAVFIKSL